MGDEYATPHTLCAFASQSHRESNGTLPSDSSASPVSARQGEWLPIKERFCSHVTMNLPQLHNSAGTKCGADALFAFQSVNSMLRPSRVATCLFTDNTSSETSEHHSQPSSKDFVWHALGQRRSSRGPLTLLRRWAVSTPRPIAFLCPKKLAAVACCLPRPASMEVAPSPRHPFQWERMQHGEFIGGAFSHRDQLADRSSACVWRKTVPPPFLRAWTSQCRVVMHTKLYISRSDSCWLAA